MASFSPTSVAERVILLEGWKAHCLAIVAQNKLNLLAVAIGLDDFLHLLVGAEMQLCFLLHQFSHSVATVDFHCRRFLSQRGFRFGVFRRSRLEDLQAFRFGNKILLDLD